MVGRTAGGKKKRTGRHHGGRERRLRGRARKLFRAALRNSRECRERDSLGVLGPLREQLDTIVRYLGSRHRDIFKLGMVSKALRRELQEVGQVDFTLLRDKHSDKVERRRLSEAVRRVYLARRFLHVGDIGRTASRRKPNTYARIAADCGVTQQELKDRVDDIDANSDSDATDPTAISDDSDPPPGP